MKGCYCLIIELEKTTPIKIGKRLGEIQFRKGYYVYVGSAMNSLEARVKRHLSDEKKLHWHVDYLLSDKNSEIVDVVYAESSRNVECKLSKQIEDDNGIEGFGCSDCECESHLYYFKKRKDAIDQVKDAYGSIALEYYNLDNLKGKF